MDEGAIVLDIGSYQCRAGFAGEERPCSVIDTQKPTPSQHGSSRHRYSTRDANELDPNDLETIWTSIVEDELRVASRDYAVLLTEPAERSRSEREKIAEIWFERFQVPGLHVASQPLLALYSTGKTSGMVVHVGERFTDLFPICEGKPVVDATFRCCLGGRDVTDQLKRLFLEADDSIFLSRRDVIHIKESHCYVADKGNEARRRDAGECVLPDGRVIELGDERCAASEVLFRPAGQNAKSIPQAFVSAVGKTENGIRKGLLSHVVFSGGTTALSYFDKRVVFEIENLDRTVSNQMRVADRVNGSLAAWIGGSMVASLGPCWEDIWVTKASYEEMGSAVIHKRSF